MTTFLLPGEVPVKHLVAAEVVHAPTVPDVRPVLELDPTPLGEPVEAVGRVWSGAVFGATIGYRLAARWARPAAVEPTVVDLVGWPGLDGDA